MPPDPLDPDERERKIRDAGNLDRLLDEVASENDRARQLIDDALPLLQRSIARCDDQALSQLVELGTDLARSGQRLVALQALVPSLMESLGLERSPEVEAHYGSDNAALGQVIAQVLDTIEAVGRGSDYS